MRVGILGGGQLGKMLAEAGARLGHECILFDPNPDACGKSAAKLIKGSYDDEDALQNFAEQVDVITYEFENIPSPCVEFLEKSAKVHPPVDALKVTQDRWKENDLCTDLGIPVTPYAKVANAMELETAITNIGYPCILKTSRLGYDGKGQIVLQSADDLNEAKQLADAHPCILEQLIAFEREVSIIATRAEDGKTVYYPLTENVHKEGILHTSTAPAEVPEETLQKAIQIADTLLQHFHYIGTMAVELFAMADGSLLLNEIAPRVHNSGHWTIEGAKTSQFANHIRAITGMPLGPTDATGKSMMINIIGSVPDLSEYENDENAHIHLYGKEERPGRKLGHITLTA